MGFEVINAESNQQSLIPMLTFDVRVENTWGRQTQGGLGSFDVLHNQPNAARLVSSGWFTVGSIPPNSSTRSRLKVPLTLEVIRQVDKLRPIQDDVHLTFTFNGYFFTPEQGMIMFPFAENAIYRISLSDWTKFVAPWVGKEVLVSISPETQKKLEELTRAGIGLKNLDDVIDELYNRELSQKKT